MENQISQILSDLKTKGILLDQYGNQKQKKLPYEFKEWKVSESSIDRISRLLKEIPVLFHERKTFTKFSPGSYGAKHVIERYFNENPLFPGKCTYCTNGEFIVALVILGFKVKFGINNDDYNCQFNAKQKIPNA